MSESYQVFFRTTRGGRGIEYETAKAEFFSVFSLQQVEITKEYPARTRMDIRVHGLDTEEISHRARMLGYTHGILHVHCEPYNNEELQFRYTERWVVGWIRKGNNKLLLTEIYRQDIEELQESYPDRRIFLIEKDGQTRAVKGRRRKRGLSPTDVKFIVNIAQLQGHEVILDPFAGLGGILRECINRGHSVFGGDIDLLLRPGLAQLTNNRCVISDARKLPFKDSLFNAIITEPPFNTRYRQAVLDSIPEILRITHPEGKIVLLIAQDMYNQIMDCFSKTLFRLDRDFTLRRHGKLISRVLVFSKN